MFNERVVNLHSILVGWRPIAIRCLLLLVGTRESLLGTILGAKGIATSSKNATSGSWHYY